MKYEILSMQNKIYSGPKHLDDYHYNLFVEQQEMFNLFNNRLHLLLL